MMTALKKSILVAGIATKLARGEKLDDILESYVNLSNGDKEELKTALGSVGIGNE